MVTNGAMGQWGIRYQTIRRFGPLIWVVWMKIISCKFFHHHKPIAAPLTSRKEHPKVTRKCDPISNRAELSNSWPVVVTMKSRPSFHSRKVLIVRRFIFIYLICVGQIFKNIMQIYVFGSHLTPSKNQFNNDNAARTGKLSCQENPVLYQTQQAGYLRSGPACF